jgi:hypothetical protein
MATAVVVMARVLCPFIIKTLLFDLQQTSQPNPQLNAGGFSLLFIHSQNASPSLYRSTTATNSPVASLQRISLKKSAFLSLRNLIEPD